VPIHHDIARGHNQEEHFWHFYCDRYPERCTKKALWPHKEFKVPPRWILVDARAVGETPKEWYMCLCSGEHLEMFARYKQAIIEELPAISPAAYRLVPAS
jgi:hypothetical protein